MEVIWDLYNSLPPVDDFLDEYIGLPEPMPLGEHHVAAVGDIPQDTVTPPPVVANVVNDGSSPYDSPVARSRVSSPQRNQRGDPIYIIKSQQPVLDNSFFASERKNPVYSMETSDELQFIHPHVQFILDSFMPMTFGRRGNEKLWSSRGVANRKIKLWAADNRREKHGLDFWFKNTRRDRRGQGAPNGWPSLAEQEEYADRFVRQGGDIYLVVSKKVFTSGNMPWYYQIPGYFRNAEVFVDFSETQGVGSWKSARGRDRLLEVEVGNVPLSGQGKTRIEVSGLSRREPITTWPRICFHVKVAPYPGFHGFDYHAALGANDRFLTKSNYVSSTNAQAVVRRPRRRPQEKC